MSPTCTECHCPHTGVPAVLAWAAVTYIKLVAASGDVGLLVPAGRVTDHCAAVVSAGQRKPGLASDCARLAWLEICALRCDAPCAGRVEGHTCALRDSRPRGVAGCVKVALQRWAAGYDAIAQARDVARLADFKPIARRRIEACIVDVATCRAERRRPLEEVEPAEDRKPFRKWQTRPDAHATYVPLVSQRAVVWLAWPSGPGTWQPILQRAPGPASPSLQSVQYVLLLTYRLASHVQGTGETGGSHCLQEHI